MTWYLLLNPRATRREFVGPFKGIRAVDRYRTRHHHGDGALIAENAGQRPRKGESIRSPIERKD